MTGAVTTRAPRHSYRGAWRSRPFKLLWSGQVVSQIGDMFYEIALIWLALKLSDQSAVAVGVVVFARAIPYAFVGLIAGAYADRWDRRRTMIAADLARMLIVLAVPLLSLAGALQLWHLAVVAALLTVARAFFQPSLQAEVPRTVDQRDLVPANSLLHAATQTASVIGPVIAGFLIAALSAEWLFVIDGATFLLSALAIAAMKLPPAAHDDAPHELPSLRAEIVGAARDVAAHRTLFWGILVFGFGLTALAGLIRVGLPLFATDVLHGGPDTFGLLMGAMGLGTVIGALLAGRALRAGHARAIFLGWCLWGGFFALLAGAPWTVVALIVITLAGVAEAVIDVAMVSLIQVEIPSRRLGKVFSFWSTIAFVGDSLSGIVIGILIAAAGVPLVFAGAGAFTVALGLLGLRRATMTTQESR